MYFKTAAKYARRRFSFIMPHLLSSRERQIKARDRGFFFAPAAARNLKQQFFDITTLLRDARRTGFRRFTPPVYLSYRPKLEIFRLSLYVERQFFPAFSRTRRETKTRDFTYLSPYCLVRVTS